MLDTTAIRSRALEVIRDFDVRPANPDLPARALSGGNQQKLIIGREFGPGPKLLLVSAELEEVTALADRLLIVHKGRIVGEVDPKLATIEEIGLLMTGGNKD